jgi:hypothetical protein
LIAFPWLTSFAGLKLGFPLFTLTIELGQNLDFFFQIYLFKEKLKKKQGRLRAGAVKRICTPQDSQIREKST